MELEKYGAEINQLYLEMQEQLGAFDPAVFETLEKLEAVAKSAHDHEFLGFVYHNIAGAYYDHGNHEQVFNYIERAIYELLRSQNREYVARTYNLFAIEAQHFGCLRLAYQYYNLAEVFLADADAPFMRALILSNTGELLCDLEHTDDARDCVQQSVDLLEQSSEREAQVSLVMATINLALQNIHIGQIEQAYQARQKAEDFMHSRQLTEHSLVRRWMVLVDAYLALLENSNEKIQQTASQILDYIVADPTFSFYTKDVFRYIQLLIDHKELELVAAMIEAIGSQLPDTIPPYTHTLFSQIKVLYYRAIGDKPKLLDSYAERAHLYMAQQKADNRLNYRSIRLMRIADELQTEVEELKRRNLHLQSIAETDPLVGIPNRHALNRVVEESFSRAIAKGTYFGVGIVDIDSFKRYNDVYGHLAGDECLKSVATTLATVAQKHDIFVARYGGDEFIYIYESKSNADIESIAAEVYATSDVAVSHGYYNEIPNETMHFWDFFMKADESLYEKKRK